MLQYSSRCGSDRSERVTAHSRFHGLCPWYVLGDDPIRWTRFPLEKDVDMSKWYSTHNEPKIVWRPGYSRTLWWAIKLPDPSHSGCGRFAVKEEKMSPQIDYLHWFQTQIASSSRVAPFPFRHVQIFLLEATCIYLLGSLHLELYCEITLMKKSHVNSTG
jgi:hypothetical protein